MENGELRMENEKSHSRFLRHCFDKINSLFIVVKNLYNSIHFKANTYDFDKTTLSMTTNIKKNKSNKNYPELRMRFHSPFSTLNSPLNK